MSARVTGSAQPERLEGAEDGLVRTAADLSSERVMTARARQAVAAAVYATLALAVLGFALDLQTLRAIAVSLFLLVELGAAPVLLLRPLSAMWFTLYTVTTSLVTTVTLGFVMSVLHLWHPFAMFGAVAVVTVVLLALAIIRDGRSSG